jgi:hypothetical protein
MSSARPPLRRSIEVEYWVVDRTGRLTTPDGLLGSPGVEREFVEPMLEVKTTPCATSDELRAQLRRRLRTVLIRAEEHEKALVPLGTTLNREAVAERPSDRTEIQNRVFGTSFQYVRHCAGTHIHVEQQPGRAVDQFNALVALDPALALVNSARYFRGRPLAAGARSVLYRRRAYSGAPRQGRLWPYLHDRADWNQQVADCYEHFRDRAVAAGVSPDALDAHFPRQAPQSALWTPVQLRKQFGTVEWRSPDTALPSHVLRLADTLTSILERMTHTEVRFGDPGRVTDRAVVLPSFETLRSHVDAAIQDGLASSSVRSYLRRMGFDVSAYDPVVGRRDAPPPVSRAEARSRRLAAADRLRRDVLNPSPQPEDA